MKKVRTPEPEGFEELWLFWRDHARTSDGRGKARPTYTSWILQGADPADILAGARWHIRAMAEKDKPYIQLLASYLNSEKWVDECEKERAYQERMAGVEASKPAQTKQEPQPARARPKTAFLAAYEQKQLLDGVNTSTEH
jgi:hypothetical protein